ncbi:MAG: ABC transporter substrate-binding protein [Limnochordales bacterium]|nr:ABC transporter substrate-binding protein [Limnochordales bacterium]
MVAGGTVHRLKDSRQNFNNRHHMMAMVAGFVLALALIGVPVEAKVKITFWHPFGGPPFDAVTQEIIDRFNQSQNQIEVVGRAADMAIEKLLVAIAAGVAPDVYYMDRYTIAERANAGMLTPLDDLFKAAGINPQEEYLPFAVAESTWRGRIYAVPHDTDARALYYRVDLFEQAGLDPSKPPATIPVLEEASRKLTQRGADGRYTSLGFVPWASQGGTLYGWGWAFGGEFYDPASQKITANHPKVVAALQWLQRWSNLYRITDIDTFFNSSGGKDPFEFGKLAMKIQTDSYMAEIQNRNPQLQYSIGPHPYAEDARMTTWSGGWSLVIPKGAPHPKEAFEFIKFFCGKEGQEIWMRRTYHLPTLRSLLDSPMLTQDPRHRVFRALLQVSRSRPPIPVSAYYWDRLAWALDQAIRQNRVPKALLDQVTEEVQRELDKVLSQTAR